MTTYFRRRMRICICINFRSCRVFLCLYNPQKGWTNAEEQMSFTTSCVCALLLVMLLDRVELSSRTFTATEGEDARLNCSYPHKEPPLPSDFTVVWKDPGGKALSNSKNNFNLVLSNVTQNQSGIYECHIHELYFQMNVHLNVTDFDVSRVALKLLCSFTLLLLLT